MIATLASVVFGFFRANAWARQALGVAGAALAILALLWGVYAKGRHDERVAQAQAIAAANAEAARQNAAILARQAPERTAEAARLDSTAKGRTDAIHAGADEAPSGPECRLNRRRLLDAGAREADLPRCP